jgi:PEP-utilising enzyme, mobile domain
MAPRWLHDGPEPAMAPKARMLAQAAAAGLPVPRGVALALDAPSDAWRGVLASLLREGPVIVRSALAQEDDAEHSAAGLAVSIADVTDEPGCAAAIERIAQVRDQLPASDRGADQVLLQHQVDARALLVLACEPAQDYLEVHAPGGDPLSSGASPRWSGPASHWIDPTSAALAQLVARVRSQWPDARHGLDLELVIARDDDAISLVQVRPLTAPLHPHWPEFAAALASEEHPSSLAGTLLLDAEHNPAPLSAAHADLVRWLAAQRPGAGGPVSLAGWLYVRTLPRELGGSTGTVADPIAVLQRLREVVLPAARARQAAIASACAHASADELVVLLERARAAFLAMIDVYLGELIPARWGHTALVADADDPLCLRDRGDVLDVLPFAWDIAAPTLGAGASNGGERAPAVTVLPSDPAVAATLLREWDDHLFALGLAPVRAVYLRAGECLGLGDQVFGLRADELTLALTGELPDVVELSARRRESWQRSATLVPPPRIIDGRPAAAAPRWLRGFAIGSDFAGRLAQRRDLADLRERPPLRDEIAVLPALTAPAAVVIAELGVRAVCCEHGGAMSHAALIARELGLSALIGCRGCTGLADGLPARIDVRCGALRIDR